jgi:hypothetical protein
MWLWFYYFDHINLLMQVRNSFMENYAQVRDLFLITLNTNSAIRSFINWMDWLIGGRLKTQQYWLFATVNTPNNNWCPELRTTYQINSSGFLPRQLCHHGSVSRHSFVETGCTTWHILPPLLRILTVFALWRFALRNFTHMNFYIEAHTFLRLACRPNATSLTQIWRTKLNMY